MLAKNCCKMRAVYQLAGYVSPSLSVTYICNSEAKIHICGQCISSPSGVTVLQFSFQLLLKCCTLVQCLCFWWSRGKDTSRNFRIQHVSEQFAMRGTVYLIFFQTFLRWLIKFFRQALLTLLLISSKYLIN